jgi:hypothetical protein
VSDTKPFDQSHYDADDSAKHLVIDWLRRRDYDAWVNDDQYGVDVIALRGDQQYGIEVEVKHAWSGARFPFTTLHYAARKLRFVDAAAPVHFFTINEQRTHALVVAGHHLLDSPIVVKQTIYTEHERFVSVPIACARLRSLDN